MDTGDPKKVKVLAAVAAVIVSVAVYRAIPNDSADFAAADQGDSPEQSALQTEGLPSALYADAFYHPAIASTPEEEIPPRTSSTSEGGSTIALSPFGWHTLPGLTREPADDPEETAGEGQQSEQESEASGGVAPRMTFTLQAILKVNKMTAIISVDGAAAEPKGVGANLTPTVSIARITENEVVLKSPSGEVSIKPGQRIEL